MPTMKRIVNHEECEQNVREFLELLNGLTQAEKEQLREFLLEMQLPSESGIKKS